MDCSVKGELLGPRAASFGVFKGPPPLINNIANKDDMDLVNENKCLMFFVKDKVKVNYIELLAKTIKDRMLTFKVNGTDQYPRF